MILLLLACDRAPTWDYGQAFAGAFEKADRDGSGRLDREEWATSSHAVPRLRDVDLDGDGGLSLAEVQASALSQDPLTFGGTEPPPAFSAADPATWHPRPYAQRVVHDLLVVLSDELGAAGGEPLDEQAIEQASASGALSSSESQEALANLRAGFLGVGLAFPEGLVLVLGGP